MLLRTTFELRSRTGALDRSLELPLSLRLDTVTASVARDTNGALRLTLDRSVDASCLELVRDSGISQQLPDGSWQPVPQIRIRHDEPPEPLLATNLADTFTFMAGEPVTHHALRDEQRFVAESEDDAVVLRRFGTDELHRSTALQIGSRTFTAKIEAGGVAALLDRAAGLRIYADAVRHDLATAKFRDLWRVLESAFGVQNDKLVALLVQYPPATQLKFDKAELKRLLVLRGRASHAATRAGIHELVRTERECGKQVERLNTLVERVILTKQRWGSRSLDVEELAAVQAYVGPDNNVVLVRPSAAS